MYKHKNTEDSVKEFHVAMGLAVGAALELGSANLGQIGLRMKLINEEFEEVDQAALSLSMALHQKRGPEYIKARLDHYVKELCDLVYVVDGAFVDFGLPKEPAFNLVHKSNMTKLDDDGNPVHNEAGKVVKGDNYVPAEFGDLLADYVPSEAVAKRYGG